MCSSDLDQGRIDKSMDKEFIRSYLSTLNWDQKPPPPPLPDEVVQKTKERYHEIADRLLS